MRRSAHDLGADAAPSGFLALVEERLRGAVSEREDGTPALLVEASRNLLLAPGGKRLRPRLVMLLGRALRQPDDELVRVAAAAEMMHGASLLHDDVIDGGHERRGRPTANARWGNARAVLAGDWLLTQALGQIAGLRRELTDAAVSTAAEMTGAAIREIEARGRTDQSFEAWRAIAKGKTGALFAWCGRAPALLAGREDAAGAFDALGRHLGVAFQMADDLRDLCHFDVGKDPCADIRSRTPSSVLVLAMREIPAVREQLQRVWADGPVPADAAREIAKVVLGHEIDAAALTLLDREIEAALASLREIRGGVDVTLLTALAAFAQSFRVGLRKT